MENGRRENAKGKNEGILHFKYRVQEVPPEKVKFEQRPEEGEGMSHVFGRRAFQVERTATARCRE